MHLANFSKKDSFGSTTTVSKILLVNDNNIKLEEINNTLEIFKKEKQLELQLSTSSLSLKSDNEIAKQNEMNILLRNAEEVGCVMFLLSNSPSTITEELLFTTIKKYKQDSARRIVVGQTTGPSYDLLYRVKEYNKYIPVLPQDKASQIALRIANYNEYYRYNPHSPYKYALN